MSLLKSPVRALSLVLSILPLSAHAAIDWNRFVPKELMPSTGKYHGEVVESEQRIAIAALTGAEKKELGLPENELAFANFRHNGVFYVATIPGIRVDKNGVVTGTLDNVVEKVVYSEKHWAGQIRKETRSIEAHSELVFYPTQGHEVRLIANQKTRSKLAQPKILNEPVVLSVEAARSAASPHAAFFPDAVGPNFAVVHRIVSNTERNIQHRDDPNREIDSNRLTFENVTSKDFKGLEKRAKKISNPMDALLVTGILRSERLGRSRTYGIATDNCTNNLFFLMDDVLSYKNGIDKEIIRKSALQFVKNDLPGIIAFLEKQQNLAESEGAALDRTLAPMLEKAKGYITRELTTSDIDNQFLASLPAFIKAHLKARGLMK